VKITVIICTHNRAETLAKTLDSIAASVLPANATWEVLVVDNNSNDHTSEVVKEYCQRYPGRFRYIFESQTGKAHALNAGIRETESQILAFTDDDVLVEADWLWNLTSTLHAGEWAGTGGRIIPVWPSPIPRWLSTNDPHMMGPFVAFDRGTEAGPLTCPPYGANMAFRREAFEKYGGFRADLSRSGSVMQGREDIEFANRVLAAGERLRYEPSAVVHHPTPAHRMRKSYVLKWWYRYGWLEVAESGPPSNAARLLRGVPLYLLRRLARWTLQWIFTIGPSRRFACLLNVWYLAGIGVACFQWTRQQRRPSRS
jgi:glycosyltransferase involved in cell wall biosynthesis